MLNETNIKVSKKNEKIVESIQDFYNYGGQKNHGHYYRYLLTFVDGVTYESNRKSDIDYWIKDAGKNEFNETINGTRYTD